MDETYVRMTTRTVYLTGEVEVHDVRILNQYSDKHYRPTKLHETLREFTSIRGEVTTEYTVTASGPVVTSKGKNHAGLSGERVWDVRDLSGPSWFPEPLRKYLVGADVLRTWSQPTAD